MQRKNIKPRTLALATSAIVALLLGLVLYLCIVVFRLETLTCIVIAVLATACGTYAVILAALNVFIYDKIKIIYKMIHDFKVFGKADKPKYFANDVIDEVERDTLTYMEAKEKEIIQLKNMEKFRKEFIGNVAHELKTPLTTIQGYILTLLDGGIYDNDINVKYLQRTAANVTRMIGTVSDLDEISRLEYDKHQMLFEKFNLYALLKDVIEILEEKARQFGVKIIVEANKEYPYYVLADKENIRKVFINLIDNAIKYNDKKDGQIRINFFEIDDNYMVEVADNGIGIAEEHLARVFERFFRVDKDRSRKTGGSGLGLAIVKHIIDAHGQTLSVRSEVGKGTTFGFTLKKFKS